MSNNLKVIYTAHGFHFIEGAPILKNVLFIFLEKLAGKWTDYLIETFAYSLRPKIMGI